MKIVPDIYVSNSGLTYKACFSMNKLHDVQGVGPTIRDAINNLTYNLSFFEHSEEILYPREVVTFLMSKLLQERDLTHTEMDVINVLPIYSISLDKLVSFKASIYHSEEFKGKTLEEAYNKLIDYQNKCNQITRNKNKERLEKESL